MIIVIAKLIRKFLLQKKQGRYVTVIEQSYLGQKNYLSLVQVQDKIILLGVGNESVEKLAEWKQEEFDNLEKKEDVQAGDSNSKFHDFLKKSWRDTDG